MEFSGRCYCHSFLRSLIHSVANSVSFSLTLTETMSAAVPAFRIHVSSATREILILLGGYQLQYRGEVELKVSFILRNSISVLYSQSTNLDSKIPPQKF